MVPERFRRLPALLLFTGLLLAFPATADPRPDDAAPKGRVRAEALRDTLAGLMAAELGRLPAQDDCVRIRNLELTVHTMRRRRIGWVHLRRLGKDAPAAADADGQGTR